MKVFSWGIFLVILLSHSARALDLVHAYDMACSYDPQFQGAVAEHDSNQANASKARTAYFPEASYARSEIQTQTTPVQTITVTQPLISFERYATAKQAAPRAKFAQATLHVRKQELALRVLKAVTDLIRARESADFNQAKIRNLERQNARANRLYELGQGTLTDVRDIQVKYDQAQANQITLDAQIHIAQRMLSALIGADFQRSDFALPSTHSPVALDSLPQLSNELETANPSLIAAKQTEQISALEAQRIRGINFPSISAAYSRSSYSGITNVTTGLTIFVPFTVGNYYANTAAAASAVKAHQDRRLAQERLRVELERTYALVQSGQDALKIKRRAIDSASLSVEANNKSYDAGVRSNIDVVNSIQMLFEVKNDYVIAVTQQAENLLSLLLLKGEAPEQAISRVKEFLFRDE
ncbi:MAG: TolC family protein [Ottowia sp.]|nr:TolC family protein [Ottowia sp.]